MRLFGQTALLFGGQVAVMALNVATGALMARGLGPEGRGAYAAVLVWPQVVGWISTLGLARATAYYGARAPGRERALVANGVFVASLAGSVMAICLAAVLPVVLRQYDPAVVGLGRALLLLVPVVALSDIFDSLLRGAGAFGVVAGTRVAWGAVQCGGILVLFLLDRLDVSSAALVWALASTAVLLAQFAILHARGTVSFRPEASLLEHSGRYGLRAFPGVLADIALQSVDQILLVPILSPGALGLYSVSTRAMLLVQLPWALSQTLFSSLAGRTDDHGFGHSVRVIAAGAAITGTAGALLFVLAAPLISLLYGVAFLPAVGAFRVLLLAAFGMGVAKLAHEAMAGMGRPGRAGFGLVLSVGLMGLLLWATVPRFGLLGAAWAVALAHWANLLLQLGFLLAARSGASSSRAVGT